MFTGYIGLGRVVDVGEDVDGFEVGDRVYTGMPHAEYVIADPSADWARTIVPVPDGASDIEGLFLGPAQIAMVALRRGTVEWGETVLVFGQGFIGHVATRLAHFAGARPVIAVNRSQPRLDYLPDLSGLETVRSDRDGWEEEVRACNGGAPVDVVVEATGNPSAIQTPFEVLKQGGRCVIASSPTESTEFDFRSHGSDQSVDIHGAIVRSPATGGSGDPWPLSRQAALYFDILDEPELDGLASVVDTYPSADAVQAFDDLENREIDGISAVIEWE